MFSSLSALGKSLVDYVSPWKPENPAPPAVLEHESDDSENSEPNQVLDFGSAKKSKKRALAQSASGTSRSPAKRARKAAKKPAAGKKQKSPAKMQSPKRKRSPAKVVKKPRAAGRATRVKTEPIRRSRRSTGYKKGAYSQKHLERIQWKGVGSKRDPIQLH
eukprot:g1162.t1